jgi:hypothetical protein
MQDDRNNEAAFDREIERRERSDLIWRCVGWAAIGLSTASVFWFFWWLLKGLVWR